MYPKKGIATAKAVLVNTVLQVKASASNKMYIGNLQIPVITILTEILIMQNISILKLNKTLFWHKKQQIFNFQKNAVI